MAWSASARALQAPLVAWKARPWVLRGMEGSSPEWAAGSELGEWLRLQVGATFRPAMPDRVEPLAALAASGEAVAWAATAWAATA